MNQIQKISDGCNPVVMRADEKLTVFLELESGFAITASAQTFCAMGRKLSGRNGKRSESPVARTKTTNPKQERKSNYEKQKKDPDLHLRRVLNPRDIGEFIAGRAAASLRRKADARRVRLV